MKPFGPFNIAYFWARQSGDQRRTGGCAAASALLDENEDIAEATALFGVGVDNAETISENTGDAAASCNNFSDARITVNNIAMGMWLWGPKGFMSGSRNGGWRLSYTHNRQYYDAGGGFDKSETENEFSKMRRWHHLENILFLRWYQRRNFLWHIQLSFNSISKMKGSKKAEEARRRFGILERGGTYQVLTVGTKWIF